MTKSTRTINVQFLNNEMTIDDFNNNDTLLIESRTGTGKTTAVCGFVQQMDKQIYSIVSKRSLASAHMKLFKSAFGEDVGHYATAKHANRHYVTTINSICNNKLTIDEIKNKIVFIDEISLFAKDLTNNSTLDDRLRDVYCQLKKIINNCYKLIVCQNKIDASAYELLRIRLKSHVDRSLMVRNTFIKQSDTCAYYHSNITSLMNKMNQDIMANKYFLCACDTKSKAELLYNFVGQHTTKERVLITSKSSYDDNFEFQDKYVIYSPSVTYGIDYNSTIKQNVYCLIDGMTIDAELIFQQIMRTRNIEDIHIYINDKISLKPAFETIDECQEDIMIQLNMARNIYNVMYDNILQFKSYDNDDNELQITENSFFKLCVVNKFISSQICADLDASLTTLFEESNIEMYEYEEPVAQDNNESYDVEELKKITKTLNRELFDEYLIDVPSTKAEEEESEQKYGQFRKINEILFNEKKASEKTTEYRDIFEEKNGLSNFYNSIYYMCTDEFLQNQARIKDINNLMAKKAMNTYTKYIMARRTTEHMANKTNDEPHGLPNECIDEIRRLYTTTKKLVLKKDVMNLFHTDSGIYTKLHNTYKLNIPTIKKILTLYGHKHFDLHNIKDEYKQLIGWTMPILPIVPVKDYFLDA